MNSSPSANYLFEKYKMKAEVIDQDARERKVGPYKPKTIAQTTKTPRTTNRGNSKEENSKSARTSVNPNSKKEWTREELRKEGRCFNCSGKGHLASECKKKKKEPSTSANAIMTEESVKPTTAPESNSIQVPEQQASNSKRPRRLSNSGSSPHRTASTPGEWAPLCAVRPVMPVKVRRSRR